MARRRRGNRRGGESGSGGGGDAEEAAAGGTVPPQRVERLGGGNPAPPARRSRVITGERVRIGENDDVIAALTGGRIPRQADGVPFLAVPRGTAVPPGRAARRPGQNRQQPRWGDDGASRSWLARLLALIFRREDFGDPASPRRRGSVDDDDDDDAARSVSGWLVNFTRRLEGATWLPAWARRAAFETVDFFSRARVYLVLAVVVLAALAVAGPRTVDALQTMTGTLAVEEETRPGLTFLDRFNGGSRRLPKKHPVVIFPGFITGALELWETKGTCLERQATRFSSFRQRMFGPQMIFLLLTDPGCWLELFSTNKTTGMDKDGIKVRADTGFTSVDYFMPGYWVWAKVLVNLADIGYDPQSMSVLTYDWRLSPAMTHARDGFFYAARNSIKFMCQKNRQRAVVVSHSYGTTVALAFFRWEEQREPGFMNRYVAYYVNVGGTTLGIPKAASALFQGDVRDTLTIPSVARKVFDTFMSQASRYEATRSWSCLYAMLPHGCDDAQPAIFTHHNGTTVNLAGTIDLLLAECARTNHTHCVQEVTRFRDKELHELPVLPQAPDTTVVCLYGVNKSAEVGYHLEDVRERQQQRQDAVSGRSIGDPHHHRDDDGGDRAAGVGLPPTLFQTNLSYNDAESVQGVRMGDGDGTVPLASLAYMCRAPNGWQQNVGRVVTVEYPHESHRAAAQNLRGSAISGDHVDILGNYDFLETVLKIVSGMDEVGADPAKDPVVVEEEVGEVDYTDSGDAAGAAVAGTAGGMRRKKATTGTTTRRRRVVHHRRVRERVLSNIDEMIHRDMKKCLAKPNNPIQPKPGRDDNEFL